MQLYTWAWHKWSRQNAHLAVSLRNDTKYIFSLSIQFLNSLRLRTENSPLYNTNRFWHILNTWDPLRTKRQVGQSERLERQPRVWAWLTDKLYVPHESILSRVTDVAVLSSTQKLRQKVKGNEETEESVCSKGKNKIPETHFNKMEKNLLPRVQNNGHKDTCGGQENNARTK